MLLNIETSITTFIGAHPVALSYSKIKTLIEEDYLVCEKTDGIRLMMLILNGHIYFYDRKNKLYLTDLVFKVPYVFLFDGELYLEEKQYVYALFDTLIYDSKARISLPLTKRLFYCFEFEKIVQKGLVLRKNDSELSNFNIIGKKMYKSYAFVDILLTLGDLKHENDGLIFTPVNKPYVLSSRSEIFKWKPPHLNTIDFLIKKTDYPGVMGLFCNVTSQQMSILKKSRSHDTMIKILNFFVQDDLDEDKLNGKIGEFVLDENKEVLDLVDFSVEKDGWTLHRIRTDKEQPNNIKIVLDTLDSIKNSLTQDILQKFHGAIKENYKKRAEAQAS